MEFLQKITSLENLFKIHPSTDFSYATPIFIFVVILFVWTYIFDFYVKWLIENNKLLHKALKGNMRIYRWVFTSIALVMLISRLEGIPILSMKFLWIVYVIVFIWYTVLLVRRVKKNYWWRLKNLWRSLVWDDSLSKYLPWKSKKKK